MGSPARAGGRVLRVGRPAKEPRYTTYPADSRLVAGPAAGAIGSVRPARPVHLPHPALLLQSPQPARPASLGALAPARGGAGSRRRHPRPIPLGWTHQFTGAV